MKKILIVAAIALAALTGTAHAAAASTPPSGTISIVEGAGPFAVGQTIHFDVTWANVRGSHDPHVEVYIAPLGEYPTAANTIATYYSYDLPHAITLSDYSPGTSPWGRAGYPAATGRAVLVWFDPKGKTGTQIVLASTPSFDVG
jgi:hypothetical protein